MSVYTSMYLHLFNAVTDALSMLRSGETASAAACLERAQRECEELFLSAPEEETGTPPPAQQ